MAQGRLQPGPDERPIPLDRLSRPTQQLQLLIPFLEQEGHVGIGPALPIVDHLGREERQRRLGLALATPEGPAHLPVFPGQRIAPGAHAQLPDSPLLLPQSPPHNSRATGACDFEGFLRDDDRDNDQRPSPQDTERASDLRREWDLNPRSP